MSTEDIFEDTDINIIDPDKDYYEELVGEGRKYKDNKALAYANINKDAFIEQLKGEQEQLRTELQTRLNLEQFLTDLKTAVPPRSSNDPQDHDQPNQDKSVMSNEDLAALVRSQLTQMKGQETAQGNLSIFSDKLRTALGPNAAIKLKSQASELGLTVDEVKSLAARNPNAALKMLGVGEVKQVDNFTAPPRSQSMSLSQSPKRGWSYYEEIRKKRPTEYFSTKISNEIFEARKAMGENFYNS